MIRRDYIERLIAQAAEAIAEALRLARAGETDPALRLLRQTSLRLLGSLGPLLDRLEAGSAVSLAGRYELDRIRVYAAIVAEEGAVHELRQDPAAAAASYRRALELYAEGSLAGMRLMPADLERIRGLLESPAAAGLAPGRLAELRRVAGS